MGKSRNDRRRRRDYDDRGEVDERRDERRRRKHQKRFRDDMGRDLTFNNNGYVETAETE